MASVFLYHVVGDLTVGKPELVEFAETDTVEAAIQAIGESTEGGITVWKKRSPKSVMENAEMRQQRFVGILNSLDIIAFLAKSECLADQDKALKTPVSEVVVPNSSLLKEVDPATRLIDALEMMKQGVKRLLVPKSIGWRGVSKRFSVLYHGKWLRNIDSFSNSSAIMNRPSSSTAIIRDKFCCLSREDVIRFLIGCLGALAPLPLTSISSLGAINPHYSCIEASLPAIDATRKIPHDPSAVAVVESTSDGRNIIIGDISSYKLWRCDYLAAAWALANLSAGQFVMGVEDNVTSRSVPDLSASSLARDVNVANNGGSTRLKKFSSRNIGFFSNSTSANLGASRSMFRGRSAPLTCKSTSTLAAVMAQMLSHRATHVWVTEAENEDNLVGVVSYADILTAVTKQSPAPVVESQTS
ncbi:OLC1v1025800C1 [Oldenlandia corymbosa var. corymbosa]|uniref:OLC1v1025800C1 n=1 Tax=Oldenlandia corymbosa var. corymbosa TaxID=529605 RepID=A0AAV1C7Z0_OLDCO|nr:OLC1v1025800C1 [Oldenlandia corymbosa var. corymbosa]